MDDTHLRADLVELLKGGSAHLTWEQALRGLPREFRAASPGRGLRAIGSHRARADRAGGHPALHARPPLEVAGVARGVLAQAGQPTDAQWRACLAGFRRDLGAVVKLVRNRRFDLTAPLPHGEGRTALREVLLVADHNAHHLGQVVQARRLLGAWP